MAAYHSHHEFAWLHIQAEDVAATRTYLEQEFGFHPLEVEDALSANERPTLRLDDDDLFLVAPAVILGKSVERYVEIAFFVNASGLVTVATDHVPFLEHLLDRCAARPEPNGDSVRLMHSLLDEIVDGYFPAVDMFGDIIDALEDDIYLGRKVAITEALALKRRLLEMRRHLTPLRDILNGMLRRDVPFIDANDQMYYQDVYDHTLRIVEDIDMERDILSSVLDAQVSVTSNSLNEVMRTLTVVSTVLMTAAFVSGIYGMNFQRMPELHWAWGYPFALLLMVLFGGLEIWYFRRRGWI
ncbi:MAG: magnesium/cobalt transporter CorA [Methanoregulaceae archaeon]|nr:magnesium/cobalt transporter CorA [Methanoregulaceae archaeon]